MNCSPVYRLARHKAWRNVMVLAVNHAIEHLWIGLDREDDFFATLTLADVVCVPSLKYMRAPFGLMGRTGMLALQVDPYGDVHVDVAIRGLYARGILVRGSTAWLESGAEAYERKFEIDASRELFPPLAAMTAKPCGYADSGPPEGEPPPA
jgi:hypothetical protein